MEIEVDGRRFAVYFGRDEISSRVYAELKEGADPFADPAAVVSRSDAGDETFTCYRENIPVAAIEHLLQEARAEFGYKHRRRPSNAAESERDLLSQLQDWYASHCDGDWEHTYGITVETLDNPGWFIRIDLKGTSLEGRDFGEVKQEDGVDWLACWVEEDQFQGAGGPHQLGELLELFLSWARGIAGEAEQRTSGG